METLGRRPCEDGGRDLKAKGTKDCWQHHQLGDRHEVHSLSEPSEETYSANIIFKNIIYLLFFYCAGSLLLPMGFL